MKAAIIQKPGILEIQDVPTPKVGPYEVLCEIVYGATCAGTDVHLIQGKHPFPVKYPTIIGHESIGRVITVGSRVKNYKEGDLVSRVGCGSLPEISVSSNWGGFAEYGIAKDHWEMRKDGIERAEWYRYRVNQLIHPSIALDEAPMIITWRETLSYAKRIGVKKDKTILVVGSGANALSFAAMSCILGAHVFVIGSPQNEIKFSTASIESYTDYHTEKLASVLTKELRDKKVDILIDAVGSSSTVNKVLCLLNDNSCVGVYGWNNRTEYGLNPFLANNSFSLYIGGYDEEETNADVQSLILQGKLSAKNWYDQKKPIILDDLAKAYQNLAEHKALKYLISVKQ